MTGDKNFNIKVMKLNEDLAKTIALHYPQGIETIKDIACIIESQASFNAAVFLRMSRDSGVNIQSIYRTYQNVLRQYLQLAEADNVHSGT